jgi:sporulation protein YlmC with PRC-barrel domain
MLKTLLAVAVAVALTVMPGLAQEMHQRPRAGSAALLVGLPVFTSDGQEIGKVIGWAKHQGEHLLIAEIERPLGIGSQTVAIPIDMFVQRVDRIELTITAEQMADKLARPEPKR